MVMGSRIERYKGEERYEKEKIEKGRSREEEQKDERSERGGKEKTVQRWDGKVRDRR